MACPRLGKVDRRLVQARHGLFDLALTIPPVDPENLVGRQDRRQKGW
jgi:hypothetical protein